MRILLLGDYSNVHHNLSIGLRSLGHEVVLASDGDDWKNYPRDIDLHRSSNNFLPTLKYLCSLYCKFRNFRGFDVVQIINPLFLPLKAERHYAFYRYLRRHNKKIIMGAFGMDYYYIQACFDRTTFRYSDFFIGQEYHDFENADVLIRDWRDGAKGELNRYVAHDCDGIVAGLYEYYAAYKNGYTEKLRYIPFPLQIKSPKLERSADDPVRFFIGIQKKRSQYKGTDIMLSALERLKSDRPKDVVLLKAESVPFDEYVRMYESADVILDQLYSYTPAMNALEAMARGLVAVSGAEREHYELMNNTDLHPIVNVEPTEESVYNQLLQIVENKKELLQQRKDSVEYVKRYHDNLNVAKQYIDFWEHTHA